MWAYLFLTSTFPFLQGPVHNPHIRGAQALAWAYMPRQMLYVVISLPC